MKTRMDGPSKITNCSVTEDPFCRPDPFQEPHKWGTGWTASRRSRRVEIGGCTEPKTMTEPTHAWFWTIPPLLPAREGGCSGSGRKVEEDKCSLGFVKRACTEGKGSQSLRVKVQMLSGCCALGTDVPDALIGQQMLCLLWLGNLAAAPVLVCCDWSTSHLPLFRSLFPDLCVCVFDLHT